MKKTKDKSDSESLNKEKVSKKSVQKVSDNTGGHPDPSKEEK